MARTSEGVQPVRVPRARVSRRLGFDFGHAFSDGASTLVAVAVVAVAVVLIRVSRPGGQGRGALGGKGWW